MLIRNCRLIPYLTEGFDGTEADIRIEDGKIAAIEKPGVLEPAGADCAESGCAPEEIIDLQGKTILPGLFDLHMHLYFSSSDFYEVACNNTVQHTLESMAYAKTFLDWGFTTIRDCGNPDYIGVALRDAVDAGKLEGPHIMTAGKCISPYAKGNDTFPDLYYEVNSPQEVFAAGRDEAARGVDFLKYMGTGSVANRTGVPGKLVTTKPELQALQDAADEAGLYVGVHCHGTEGIRLCAEVGVRTIEHASLMTDDTIELILKKGNRSCLVPTLSPVVDMHNAFEAEGVRDYMTEKIEICYRGTSELVKSAEAGLLLGWGTDVSRETFLRKPGLEFLARRQVGFTNRQILEQATVNSARIVGREDRYGTVKVGKAADLIAVNGDPDEDIAVMTRRPAAVWLNGRQR